MNRFQPNFIRYDPHFYHTYIHTTHTSPLSQKKIINIVSLDRMIMMCTGKRRKLMYKNQIFLLLSMILPNSMTTTLLFLLILLFHIYLRYQLSHQMILVLPKNANILLHKLCCIFNECFCVCWENLFLKKKQKRNVIAHYTCQEPSMFFAFDVGKR